MTTDSIKSLLPWLLGCSLLAGGLLTGGCRKNNSAPAVPDSVYYTRQAYVVSLDDQFVLYDTILNQVGLRDTLAQAGPFTTFAPDNNSVSATGWGSITNGYINGINVPTDGRSTLMALIVRGANPLKSLPAARNMVLTSLQGLPLFISKYQLQGDTVVYTVNGTSILTADFPASNGPMEIIDQRIPNIVAYRTITDYVNSQPTLTFLSLAMKRTGLDKVLGGTDSLTLLAPTNGDFQALKDPQLNSLDSLETVDTAKLGPILRFNVLVGRYFQYDLVRKVTAPDSVGFPSLQGETVYVFVDPNYGNFAFKGGSDALSYWGWYIALQGGPGTNPRGDGDPTDIDVPVANGVVHQMNSLMFP